MALNTAQQQAVDARDSTLLVSAAAGSGKTYTLTQRIISLLTENSTLDIDSLLIVTYTRAAADELRQKTSAALSKAYASADNDDIRTHLQNQLIKMSSAKISTIDSFYLDIVRANFNKLDEKISPSFRTADVTELKVLAKNLMEDVISDFYKTRQAEISNLSNCFVGLKNDSNLSNVFLNLYSKTEPLPEGISFLKDSSQNLRDIAKNDILESSFGDIIIADVLDSMEYFRKAYEDFSGATDFEFYKDDISFMDALSKTIKEKNYRNCYDLVTPYTFTKAKFSDAASFVNNIDLFKDIRQKFKDKSKKIKNDYFGISPDNIVKAIESTAKKIDLIHEILETFEAKFKEEKRQKNVMSFNDIKRAAYKIVVKEVKKEIVDGVEQEIVTPTPIALEYRKKFSQIYIDEYQDVDRQQDHIFKAIANENARFMVGDVKQSIYGFRGAEPDLFVNYKKAFPDINSPLAASSHCASIFMSENYRCDDTVIDFANEVCSCLFRECKDSIGYTPADDLKCSKNAQKEIEDKRKEISGEKKEKDSKRVTMSLAPTEVTFILTDDKTKKDSIVQNNEEDLSNAEIEARYIAVRIREFLDSTKDETCDELKIRPEHIAVLYRKKEMGSLIAKELATLGIDYTSDANTNYFEKPEVLLVLSLLNTINNPQKDIYLAGVLRSPFFNFSLDDLIEIRSSQDEAHSLYDSLKFYCNQNNSLAKKCSDFVKKLSSLRNDAAAMPVDKLLKKIFYSDLFIAAGLSSFDPSNDLVFLYECARKFESSSFKGLYNFISHINKLIEENDDSSTDFVSSCEGKVSLMSIHHSKGLEFPICFLSRTGAPFSTQDAKESLVFDSHTGVALKLSDDDGLARINTPIRSAILHEMKRRQVEEEMRLLYVALTRARERLIVTGNSGASEYDTIISKAEANRKYLCKYSIMSSSSYLEWILTAIDENKEYPFCKLSFIKAGEVEKYNVKTADCSDNLDEAAIAELEMELDSKFSFVYKHKAATTLPAKISVSALVEEKNKNNKAENTTKETYDSKYRVPDILKGSKTSSSTPAERGTATHLFLQFCDFRKLKEVNGVESEINRLIEERYIPTSSRELIFKDELEKFVDSDLFEMITNAKKVLPEQRFNIMLPTDEYNSTEDFIKETENEFLAVQGVIDLIIENENGDIYLVDYKTDRLSEELLNNDANLKMLMQERHGQQLSIYAKAIKSLFDKDCSGAFIYSTNKGALVEIAV